LESDLAQHKNHTYTTYNMKKHTHTPQDFLHRLSESEQDKIKTDT